MHNPKSQFLLRIFFLLTGLIGPLSTYAQPQFTKMTLHGSGGLLLPSPLEDQVCITSLVTRLGETGEEQKSFAANWSVENNNLIGQVREDALLYWDLGDDKIEIREEEEGDFYLKHLQGINKGKQFKIPSALTVGEMLPGSWGIQEGLFFRYRDHLDFWDWNSGELTNVIQFPEEYGELESYDLLNGRFLFQFNRPENEESKDMLLIWNPETEEKKWVSGVKTIDFGFTLVNWLDEESILLVSDGNDSFENNCFWGIVLNTKGQILDAFHFPKSWYVWDIQTQNGVLFCTIHNNDNRKITSGTYWNLGYGMEVWRGDF